MIYKGDFGRLFLWRLLHRTRRTVLARYFEKRYFEFGRGRGSCLEITLISEKPLFERTNVLNCSLCSRASHSNEWIKACKLSLALSFFILMYRSELRTSCRIKKARPLGRALIICAPSRTRTWDLRINSPSL